MNKKREKKQVRTVFFQRHYVPDTAIRHHHRAGAARAAGAEAVPKPPMSTKYTYPDFQFSDRSYRKRQVLKWHSAQKKSPSGQFRHRVKFHIVVSNVDQDFFQAVIGDLEVSGIGSIAWHRFMGIQDKDGIVILCY